MINIKRLLSQLLVMFWLLIGNGILLCSAQTADPVLYFTDITSGPKLGNSDASSGRVAGLDGAIVTIWGVNLGATRGDSKVVCNGADAASYYYWGNATAPSNMHAYHKMQMISFQVSHLARDGAGEISVTVNGRQSNSLSYIVRSGNIYFVKTGGDDNSGNGSWTQPWKSIANAVATIAVGDIAYIGDGVDATIETDFSAAINLGSSGTAANPKALAVYPGATSRVGNPDLERAFHIWNLEVGGYSEYWVLSKFTITTIAVGVFANTGFRVVGNRFTAPKTNGGMEGCLYAIGSDVYLLGNELHNVGSFTSDDKMPHVIYVTGVRRDDPPRAATEQNREIAWNYLHDNGINRGMQIYSEQANSAYIQRHRVHDNVIVNQRGDGILMGYYVTGENWIYNNLIINAGLGPDWAEATFHTGIHLDTGHENVSGTNVYCYNNTLYGCGFSGAAFPDETGHILITAGALQHSNIRFSNNIIYSTGEPYIAGESSALKSGDHRNSWFGKGAAPGWDTGAINTDPEFADINTSNFQLKSTSPCINTGIDVLSVVERDLLGVKRIGGAIDLGAYEYFTVSTCVAPAKSTLISPSGTIYTTKPTYTWNFVAEAEWYGLYVDDSSSKGKIYNWYTAAQANCPSGGTCSATPTTALAPGIATFWVVAWKSCSGGTYGLWSEPMVFTVSGACTVPAKPALISPSNNITTTTPTYKWNAVSTATWYYLWVNDSLNRTGKIQLWFTSQQAGCALGTGACSVAPAIPLASGSCQWWVQTWNDCGYGPWSDGMTFTVASAGPPGKATLNSPSGTIAIASPTYTWNAVANSSWYQLWVNDNIGSPRIQRWFTAAQAGCPSGAGTCFVTPATALAAGSYQWWIQTWNDSGYGPWSDAMSFTIASQALRVKPSRTSESSHARLECSG